MPDLPEESTPEAQAMLAAFENHRIARERVRAVENELRDAVMGEVLAKIDLDKATAAFNALTRQPVTVATGMVPA